MTDRIVVVGAAAAGLTCAETLRNRGYDGTLTVLGEEPHTPYDRPPLSKQVLAGTWEPDRVMLRGKADLAKLDAEFRLGRAAVGLDVAAREVLLAGGERVGYDGLVIATGVTPRTLPGADLAGVHLLRTLDDTLSLRAALLAGARVVVVGAGFLGTEVAAAARTMGLDVTIVDPLPTPLHRQVGEEIGGLVGQHHADHGVHVRCGVGVRGFASSAGRVTAVELADSTSVPADVVVIAIGATPAVGWLADSGLPIADGVDCDEFCRAAPGVYAAGDVASWHNNHFDARMRLEHRVNATEQAMCVARNLLGEQVPFTPIPYFWTDQYEAKIQAYGIMPPGAEMSVLHGEVDSRRFVAAFGHRDRVVGVIGWGSPRELRKLRQLVVDRAPWPPERVG